MRRARNKPVAKPKAPTFFASPAAFRAWLAAHHTEQAELLVGFHKRGSGRPSMTWPESVDEALCFGWIDGVRRSLGADAYTIRFTPRKPTSVWSAINVGKVAKLTEQDRMQPAGLRVFAARRDSPGRSTSRPRWVRRSRLPTGSMATRRVPLEHFTRFLDFAVCHREGLIFFEHVDTASCEPLLQLIARTARTLDPYRLVAWERQREIDE
jgi:hypothetical protein